MLERLRKTLWGSLTTEEFERFSFLSLILLCIIGSYWLMKPLKDGIFISIVGRYYLPFVKMASFAIMLPLVVGYAKLVDLVAKQKLFYILCSFYTALFLVISLLLMHESIGLPNTNAHPSRLLGWILYLGIESFGSLLISLFWSFVASSTTTQEAKRGYGLIIFGSQIGAIVGPAIAIKAPFIGVPMLTAIVAMSLFLIPFLIKRFIAMFPATIESEKPETKHTNSFEGLHLLFTRKYLLGILGISTLCDAVGSILELQMNFLAADAFNNNAAQITSFLGSFGFAANTLAFLFALTGTSFFIRTFGLTFCLVAYPICTAIVVILVWWHSHIWIFFIAMIAIKALNYALNIPCREIMYIPTSRDIKFKAKSVIDMFGGRSSKAGGAGIMHLMSSTAAPILYNSIACFAIIGVWISAAFYVGKVNKHLTENNKIIE